MAASNVSETVASASIERLVCLLIEVLESLGYGRDQAPPDDRRQAQVGQATREQVRSQSGAYEVPRAEAVKADLEDTERADPSEPRLVYRIREVQETLGIGRDLVYKLINSGQLAHVKAGNAMLVPAHSLEKFLAGEGSPGSTQ